jgi:RNA polymerase sigma-70 factor (ECF subfamily)
VEAAARDSYGRLLAFLASRTRDVAGAEDALGDALLAALETWPRDGVPDSPEAWLLTAAGRSPTSSRLKPFVSSRPGIAASDRLPSIST